MMYLDDSLTFVNFIGIVCLLSGSGAACPCCRG
jgi:hypothetical protein